jgi:hypothetical protein
MAMIIAERLARVTKLKLGNTDPNDDARFCVMEAVAYVAGEPWSDHPVCTCPVITAFMVSWNDGLPDAERSALLTPLVPLLVGTRGSKATEDRRANMAVDWYIRVQTPAWLRLAGLTKQAEALEAFPEITDFASVPSLMPTLTAIRADASAARDAAWATSSAARDAAYAAHASARAAANAAANAAFAAAREAAFAAASSAAREAAGDGARAAARDALDPTKTALQASAVDLVKRMCALTDQPS